LALLAATAAVAVALDILVELSGHSTAPALDRLQAAAGAFAVLGGTAAALRSRVDGFAPAWWVGTSMVAVGAQCLAGDPTTVTASMSPSGLQTAAGIVALGCAARAALSPAVDTTISPVRTLVGCGLAGVLLVPLAELVGSTAAGPRIANVTVALAFGVLALVVVRRRRRHVDAIWPGLLPLVVGLGLAALVAAAGPPTDEFQPLGSTVVLLVTFCFATVEVVGELRAAGSLQRRAAYEAELLRRKAEHNRQRVEERYAETLHEVRSTVRALEGGVRHLDLPTSDEEQHAHLARALVDEIERLHLLVSGDGGVDAGRYHVGRALEPMLTVAASGGWPVRWELADDLEAWGRPAELAQVVYGLLENATRYAPGSPIDVSARADGAFVLVRVDDRGPGIERGARDAIFERGFRAARDRRDGNGLGLYIARSMLRRTEGDLWVEPRIGGGSSFVVAVPTPPASPAARENVTTLARRRRILGGHARPMQGVGG
jgi:two-component system OmpR family sensor kinase